MIRTRVIRTLAFSLTAMAAAPHAAAQATVVNYICNLDGVQGQLTAQVEAVDDAGIVQNIRGDITGVIGTGNYNLRYAGQLVSPAARYSFTGENGFADFVDLTSNARFHVQFIVQGTQLMLVANPETQQPARYLCQQAR
jgi:hypothetical protein